MTPPSTANPSPPACLWLKARRIAADSSSPDCRWLKLAGLPLTHARWSSLAGKANSLLSSRRRLRLTDPAVRGRSRRRPWGKPTHRRRFTRPAAGWGSLQPAGPCRWVVKPAGCCRYCQASRLWSRQPAAAVLTSQPAVAVIDQTVTMVFLITVFVCV